MTDVLRIAGALSIGVFLFQGSLGWGATAAQVRACEALFQATDGPKPLDADEAAYVELMTEGQKVVRDPSIFVTSEQRAAASALFENLTSRSGRGRISEIDDFAALQPVEIATIVQDAADQISRGTYGPLLKTSLYTDPIQLAGIFSQIQLAFFPLKVTAKTGVLHTLLDDVIRRQKEWRTNPDYLRLKTEIQKAIRLYDDHDAKLNAIALYVTAVDRSEIMKSATKENPRGRISMNDEIALNHRVILFEMQSAEQLKPGFGNVPFRLSFHTQLTRPSSLLLEWAHHRITIAVPSTSRTLLDRAGPQRATEVVAHDLAHHALLLEKIVERAELTGRSPQAVFDDFATLLKTGVQAIRTSELFKQERDRELAEVLFYDLMHEQKFQYLTIDDFLLAQNSGVALADAREAIVNGQYETQFGPELAGAIRTNRRRLGQVYDVLLLALESTRDANARRE